MAEAHGYEHGSASNPKHFLAGKTIVVAGAGISGLAFAVGLRRLWNPDIHGTYPELLIYDRDSPDVDMQREGYSLSLSGYDRNSGGLVALQKLGLLDRILDCAVSGVGGKAGSFKIWGTDWTERAVYQRKPVEGLPTSSLRIARKDLRGVLTDGAFDTQNNIRWDSRCVSTERLDNGRLCVRICQTRGSQESTIEQECDLLVAADGASSKLREQLRPNDKLEYTGAILRGGMARFDNGLPNPPGSDWGFMISDMGVTCFYSPVDANSVFWGVGHLESRPAPPLDRASPSSAQAVVDRGRKLGSPFHEPFKSIVDNTDMSTVLCVNARDKLPFPHGDAINDLPVIFIGDSNHAMSPFAGFGANVALCDGWDLAEKLCDGRSLREAVDAYDQVSVPRAEGIIKNARKRLREGHSVGWRKWLFWVMLAVTRFFWGLFGK